jgi:hypothetical protein
MSAAIYTHTVPEFSKTLRKTTNNRKISVPTEVPSGEIVGEEEKEARKIRRQ